MLFGRKPKLVRDPWFPIAVMLIPLLAVALGLFGPESIAAWLKGWQTLAAAVVASIAAYIAFQNTTRSLTHAERLEANRRSRKHAATRAVLPVALSHISEYAEKSARTLLGLAEKCVGETLPRRSAPEDLAQPLPTDTLKAVADFIEYADAIDLTPLENTIAWIQIHDSRVRSIVEDNRNPASARTIVRSDMEGCVVDAAAIYAGAACGFDYARRRTDALPSTITWDAVRSALRNMSIWPDEHPRLFEMVDRREQLSDGPFDKLRVDLLDIAAGRAKAP